MGYYWVDYMEKDGFYIFVDFLIFDLYIQEFIFKVDILKIFFEVCLIVIFDGLFFDNVDEVMLYVNFVDLKLGFDVCV